MKAMNVFSLVFVLFKYTYVYVFTDVQVYNFYSWGISDFSIYQSQRLDCSMQLELPKYFPSTNFCIHIF